MDKEVVQIRRSGDASLVQGITKTVAMTAGFNEGAAAELVLVATELATNLTRHADGGILTIERFHEGGRTGIRIESVDEGPGISDVERAFKDGYSSSGSLGYGLGTVNRFVDELSIVSRSEGERGTRITCRRWIKDKRIPMRCPFSYGAATRSHPGTSHNGDSFVLHRWNGNLLAGVIDGLGHGKFAQEAAHSARKYAENHFDQPLEAIFRGAGRACSATRGVVMALARFSWNEVNGGDMSVAIATVGNVEIRIFGNSQPLNIVVRRGIVGYNAPNPYVVQHPWKRSYTMVLHSDGVRSGWNWKDCVGSWNAPAPFIARQLLVQLAKNDDDATVLVVKNAE